MARKRDKLVAHLKTWLPQAGSYPDRRRLLGGHEQIFTGDIEIDQLAHGEGLGLWYVHREVRSSDGNITVTDQLDGTEIRLPLPKASG